MHIVKHTIWIARRREQVFAFFADFSQASTWRQYVESMEVIGGGPVGVGTRIRSALRVLGDVTTFEMEVLAYEPPSLWQHHTFENDFTGYVEYRFEDENDGTRVTLTMNVIPKTLYGWLAIPPLWLRRKKTYAEQLPSLKRVLEAK